MKIKALLMAIFCVHTIMVQADNSQGNKKITLEISVTDEKADVSAKKNCIKRLYSSYVGSLVVGGCVGAVTGSVVRYLEKKLNIADSPIGFFLFILSWLYEPEFRHDILATIQLDFDTYGIKYSKNSMSKMAWVASWLAYLRA